MKQGGHGRRRQALGMSQQQLEQMTEQLQEMETLDAALADLQDAKEGMTGEGMNQLGSRLGEMEGFSPGDDQGSGNGLGRGRGRGASAPRPDRTNAYDTNVKGQLNRGKVIPLGFAPPVRPDQGRERPGDPGDPRTLRRRHRRRPLQPEGPLVPSRSTSSTTSTRSARASDHPPVPALVPPSVSGRAGGVSPLSSSAC